MPFVRDALLGANLTEVRTSTEGAAFDIGTTVVLDDASSDAGRNKLAVYVAVGDTLTISNAVALNANYTASASAGGFIWLGDRTAVPTEFGWVRTSANRA